MEFWPRGLLSEGAKVVAPARERLEGQSDKSEKQVQDKFPDPIEIWQEVFLASYFSESLHFIQKPSKHLAHTWTQGVIRVLSPPDDRLENLRMLNFYLIMAVIF